MFNKKMNMGFTLAEVLITLGIVGVVSMLTLPTLMANYQRKVYVAQLQKIYNQVSNAAVQIMSDEDVDNLADIYIADNKDNYINSGNFLKKYFKVVKDCGMPTYTEGEGINSGGCYASVYSSFDKSSTSKNVPQVSCYAVIINTGASLCMTNMSSYNNGKHGWADIVVDVNGPNLPNVSGRDLFSMRMYSDGRVGDFYIAPKNYNLGERCSKMNLSDNFGYGANCLDKIVADGWKMDY